MARREQVLRKKAEKLEVKGLENTEVTTQCLSAIEELLHDVYIIRRPESIDYYFRRNLIRIFNEIAKEIYGNCEDCPVVEGFGSFLMDIFSTKSDMDLSVNFRSNAVEFPREKKIQTLRKFAKKLYAFQRKGHVSSLQPIMSAKVPILKVVDCGTGIECDISVENRDGMVKSKIVHIISSIDERFRKLSFLMKSWAKAHNINSSKDRTLSSLAIISLVAFHLQTRDPPILPPFSSILSDGTDPAVVAKTVQKFLNYGEKNKESLAELFMTLLIKLAAVETLWPKGLCASTYEGLWISKKWNFKVGFISVEDFTDRSLNIARAVRKAEVTKIYKCINLSIRYIKAFLDGQIKVPKLKGFLFGPNSLPIPVANGTTGIGTSETQPSIPLDPTQIKKMRVSDGWGGTNQDVPIQPTQKKVIASTNGWEGSNSGGWEGSQTKGWGGADVNSWDRALTHTEGWGGLNTKSWGGTNTKSWESWGQHMERWGGTNAKNWGGTNAKNSESWGGMNTKNWGGTDFKNSESWGGMNTKSSGDAHIGGRGGTKIKSWGGTDTKSWGQMRVGGLGGTNGKSTKSWGGTNIESWGQTHTKVWGGTDTMSRGRTHTKGGGGSNTKSWGGMNTKSWGGMHTGNTASWGGTNTKTWGGTDTKSMGQTHTEGWGATKTKNWGGPNPKSWGGTNREGLGGTNTKIWGGTDTKSMEQTHAEGWGATNTKDWGGLNTKSWGGTDREGLGGTDTKRMGRTRTVGWGATNAKKWGGPNTKGLGGTNTKTSGGMGTKSLGQTHTEGRGGTHTKSWGGTHAEGWGRTNTKRGTQSEGWGGGDSKSWRQTQMEGWGGSNKTTLEGWGGGDSKSWGQTQTEGWGGSNTTTLGGSSTSGCGGTRDSVPMDPFRTENMGSALDHKGAHQVNGTTSNKKNPSNPNRFHRTLP